MVRVLSFSAFEQEHFLPEVLSCKRQFWKDGSAWTGFLHTARGSNALTLICSEVEARYRFSDGRELVATGGDVVLIPRGSLYTVSFHNCGRGVDMYTVDYLLYDKEGNELLLSREAELFHGAANAACRGTASELADVFLAFGENRLKKQEKFTTLLAAVVDALQSNAPGYYPIRKGVNVLLREWDKNEPVSRYAAAAGMSESGFYAAFRSWAGVSPVVYRNNIRMRAAVSMLQNTSLTVAEIAKRVGFDDPYYFSRKFHRHFGVSPRAFRCGGKDDAAGLL